MRRQSFRTGRARWVDSFFDPVIVETRQPAPRTAREINPNFRREIRETRPRRPGLGKPDISPRTCERAGRPELRSAMGGNSCGTVLSQGTPQNRTALRPASLSFPYGTIILVGVFINRHLPPRSTARKGFGKGLRQVGSGTHARGRGVALTAMRKGCRPKVRRKGQKRGKRGGGAGVLLRQLIETPANFPRSPVCCCGS